MRGPASKSWTREPKPLKIEATCTPVAPAPTTNIDGGDFGQAPGIAVGGGEFESGDRQPSAGAAGTEDDCVGLKSQPALGCDRVRIDEACGAGVFVDRHAQAVEVLAPSGMRAHIAGNLADAREEPGIVKHRLTHGDAVLIELAGLPDQPGRVGECSNRHWSVVGRHAAKFVAGDECRLGAQPGGTVRGEDTGRSCANHDDVRHSRSPLTSRINVPD